MKAYRFRVPLVAPLKLKGRSYTHREGVLLERDGRWAEASPLPGFSMESIDDVVAAIHGDGPEPGSLQFALAVLDDPIAGPIEVPWNFLLLGDRSEVLKGVKRSVGIGVSAVKLKVGHRELESDIELVKDVRHQLPDDVQLRLDANQAWTMEQAIEFVAGTSDVEFEYVEEPLQTPARLEELYSKTGIRYALDESLLQFADPEQWPGAVALVVKPTMLGGRKKIVELSRLGKPLIFSAAFESGVGVARIAQLAAEFSPKLAAGLDTLDWLSDDLLQQSAQKRGGRFVVPGEPKVDPRLLERIL